MPFIRRKCFNFLPTILDPLEKVLKTDDGKVKALMEKLPNVRLWVFITTAEVKLLRDEDMAQRVRKVWSLTIFCEKKQTKQKPKVAFTPDLFGPVEPKPGVFTNLTHCPVSFGLA